MKEKAIALWEGIRDLSDYDETIARIEAAMQEAARDLPAKVTEFLRDLAGATEYKSHPLGYEDSLDRHWKEDAAELLAELEAAQGKEPR